MVTPATPKIAGSDTTAIEVGCRSIHRRLKRRYALADPARSTVPHAVMSNDGSSTSRITGPVPDPASLHARPDWQAAVQRIRDTAGWITKAFVAIATLLIGTGPLLVRVSDLTIGPRAFAAGLGAAIALLGVGLVIRYATEVMLPQTTDLAELVTAERGPLLTLRNHVETSLGRRIYLDRDVADVGGLIDAIEGWQRTVESLGRYAQQVAAYETQEPRPKESTLPEYLRDPAARASVATTFAGARARLQQLNMRAAELVTQGVYVEMRDIFIRARRMMLVGGALTAIGVAIYITALSTHSDTSNKATASVAISTKLSVKTMT
jgi:hypothetical protein